MPRNVLIRVYKVSELSDDAKKEAFQTFCSTMDYYPHSDNKKTLEAFEGIFPIIVHRRNYGFEFTGEGDIEKLSNIRLLAHLQTKYHDSLFAGKYYSNYSKNSGRHVSRKSNVIKDTNCVLTGYYIDCDILQPIYDFIKKPDNRNFSNLMTDCISAWLLAVHRDMEDYYDMEHFLDMSEANDWDYTEDGKIFILRKEE